MPRRKTAPETVQASATQTAQVIIGTQAPSAPISFEQMVSSNAVPVTASTKKKKNAAPVVTLPANLIPGLKKFLKAKEEEKLAQSTKAQEEVPLLAYVREIQDKNAFDGNYHSSYDVVAGEITVKFIATDKFKVNAEPPQIAALREMLGAKFETYIKCKQTPFVLKPNVLTDENLKRDLVALLGARYADFFETRSEYVSVEGFDEKIYEAAGSPEKLPELRELVAQSKPYIK